MFTASACVSALRCRATRPAARAAVGATQSQLSDADAAWLAAARGKKLLDKATVVTRVAARGDNGQPAVVECYPLRRADHALRTGGGPGGGSKRKWISAERVPWPNLFWLVDPGLQVRVGRLEHLGCVRVFRERLLADPATLALFSEQHKRYARRRWALLTDEDASLCEREGFGSRLRDAGIGGLTYFAQVKCLHCHYAHWLATGDNIVGEWIAEALANGVDAQTKTARASNP